VINNGNVKFGVDSICLAQKVLALPDTGFLEDRGWVKVYQSSGRYSWQSVTQEGTGNPSIRFYTTPHGKLYLCAALSLPKFYHGNNSRLLDDTSTEDALRRLSAFISLQSGLQFDTFSACIWKVDFTADMVIGEKLIRPIIAKVQKAGIPHHNAGGYDATTAYFHWVTSKRKRSQSRVICVYGKYEDAKAKRFPIVDLLDVRDTLRIESRFRKSRTVKAILEPLGLPRNSPEFVLRTAVAQSVLQPLVDRIQKLTNEARPQQKILTLIDIYGPRRARALQAFLQNRDLFGPGLEQMRLLGYSQSNCYKCLRDCEAVNILSLSDDGPTQCD
jgi:hypothetical protein